MALLNKDALNRLDKFLNKLIMFEGSDLHIKSDSPPSGRIHGDIRLLSEKKVEHETIKALVMDITGARYDDFHEKKEYDGSYSLNGKYRFRVNISMHISGYALAFRLIPTNIKTIEMLNLPKVLHKLKDLKRGLVLVTGTTGSGKSSTLAAIIEEINNTYSRHIVTIEDPAEFIHHDRKSIIEQREIGINTQSFSNALRSAMREDPDIIVVGEIRDLATAQSIIHAVNTGHLIFSTLHTLNTYETVDRLIGIFPPSEQDRIRATLASTLEAVVCQRLVTGISGDLYPAIEVMFKSPQIKELIRSKRDHEILDAIENSGERYGSMSFNQSLYALVLNGLISEESAYEYATSPADLKLLFTTSNEYESKMQEKEDEAIEPPKEVDEEYNLKN